MLAEQFLFRQTYSIGNQCPTRTPTGRRRPSSSASRNSRRRSPSRWRQPDAGLKQRYFSQARDEAVDSVLTHVLEGGPLLHRHLQMQFGRLREQGGQEDSSALGDLTNEAGSVKNNTASTASLLDDSTTPTWSPSSRRTPAAETFSRFLIRGHRRQRRWPRSHR